MLGVLCDVGIFKLTASAQSIYRDVFASWFASLRVAEVASLRVEEVASLRVAEVASLRVVGVYHMVR